MVTKKKTTAKTTIKDKILKHPQLPWAVAVLFIGAFVGTMVHGLSWSQNFQGEDRFVANGQTWIPVKGEPLAIKVLTDPTCGAACDPTSSLAVLRQNISPALVTETIDVTSKEGRKLVEDFAVKSIPQYIFDTGIAKIKAADGSLFIDNLPPGFFTEKDGLYHLNNTSVGFRVGKFIEDPEFADLDTEPKKGSGPVTVVEFTDYQCPFCRRLHDQNKDLITQLIAENKITYVLKDFPLNFHADAVDYAHAVANCALKEGGQDAYWTMNSYIFDQTDQWSNKGDAGRDFLVAKVNELGFDISACLADANTKAEIGADQAEGQLYGVSGTPALFIGGQVMPGAIGPDVFAGAVEAELKKQ